MAQAQKDNRIVIRGKKARKELIAGAKFAYDAITATYGPKGTNVMLEKPFGRPKTTRDGVSVARDTYSSDRPKNMGTQRVLEASETTNRIAGDGTTATAALTYHLMKRGALAIAAGTHPMEIKKRLLDDSYKILDRLNELTIDVKDGQLKQVATISSGDPLLGQLISEAIEKVGADGGIIAEKAPVDDIEREYVDGYYLQSGFQALEGGKKELNNPQVIVSIKRLSSAAEIADVLTRTLQSVKFNPQTDGIPRFLLIGNIEDAAYINVINLIKEGKIDAIVLRTPPQFGDMGKQLLEDIAIYASCRPILDGTNTRELNESHVGTVDKVVASKSEATLFTDNETEAVKTRVQEIKDQIKSEAVDAISEKLKDRVAKLEGKIALFRIGGATDSVKEEVEDRVEDAIHATRAAVTYGVVAGGGITLLELSKLDISDTYRNALRDTFKQLLINANVKSDIGLNDKIRSWFNRELPFDKKIEEVLNAPTGFGFNLREKGELVNMVKSGVLDPSLVVEQIIKNATASATDMLTTDTLIVFEDTKEV